MTAPNEPDSSQLRMLKIRLRSDMIYLACLGAMVQQGLSNFATDIRGRAATIALYEHWHDSRWTAPFDAVWLATCLVAILAIIRTWTRSSGPA